MTRLLPMIIAVLLLAGCDEGISSAQYQSEVAAKGTAQFIACLLGASTVVALIVGAALGSRAANE
jgi:hypothetical protein